MIKLLKFLAFLSIVVSFLVMHSCRDIYDQEIYQRPSWLEGKLYEQLKSREEFSIYTKCLEATEWANIIGKTGYYTVFAPTDEAFNAYFQQHPKYKKFEDFLATPEDSIFLDGLVRYSIIFNGWSIKQLTTMTMSGFWDPRFSDNEDDNIFLKPIAFKRQTLYEELPYIAYVKEDVPVEIYGSVSLLDQIKLSPSVETVERTIITDGNKYVPMFYKNYLDAFEYTGEDYEFFFQREFDPNGLYFAGAKIEGDEVFAENGFLYAVDKVVEPLPNIFQVLKGKDGEERNYSEFFELANSFNNLFFESDKTKEQPGYSEGLAGIKNLYSINFGLLDDIDKENTSYTTANNMFYQKTSLAPTNAAFNTLLNDFILGFPNYNTRSQLPIEVMAEIVLAYQASDVVYKKEMTEGFLNLSNDSIQLDESDVEEAIYCSNGTFLGVNKPIIPKALNSVARPVYLRPGYSVFLRAMAVTNLLAEIKRFDKTYSFFTIDDITMSLDSSLMFKTITHPLGFNYETLVAFDMAEDPPKEVVMGSPQLTPLLMNQICEGAVEGVARYEFLRTIGGYILRVDNETGTVRGSANALQGLNGSRDTVVYFTKLEDENIKNGNTYQTNAWLNFSSALGMHTTLRNTGRQSGDKSRFLELCILAGIADENGMISSEISQSEFYTIFVPNDAAFAEYEEFENVKLNDLPAEELKQFMRYHFLRGEMIFTDGKIAGGKYPTLRVDESSTNLIKRNSLLNIDAGYDYITILDNNGVEFTTVEPQLLSTPNSSFSRTNLVVYSRIPDPFSPAILNTFASGVVHEINTVLVYEK